MNLSKLSYRCVSTFIVAISLCFASVSFADRGFGGVGGVGGIGGVGGVGGIGGVGGFHNGVGNNYHFDNDINVGNYHPGNGWVGPTVIYNTGGYNNCQVCDSDGNCIQNDDCD